MITIEQMGKFLDTFRSPVWLVDHCWYVRCHYQPVIKMNRIPNTRILLYTLPYCFEDFTDFRRCNRWKSTCPDDQDYSSYSYVRDITVSIRPLDNFSSYPCNFPSVESFDLRRPYDGNFSSLIPTLNLPTSLSVYMYNEIPTSKLQVLLEWSM
jgi:hypothetical protein